MKPEILPDGLCSVEGIRAWGGRYGKYGAAMIKAPEVCKSALVITRNKIKAAPLLVTKENVKNGIRAVIVNSGNANCATGKRGMEDARKMAEMAAKKLGVEPKNVAVASTGIIGKYLDLDALEKAVGGMKTGSSEAAKAIMTTDTKPKELAVRFELENGEKGTIAGICKGSGMIRPDMATMLCFLVTDVDAGDMQAALKEATDKSFNCISVDNDMSTNDMVLLMSTSSVKSDKSKNFLHALTYVCQELAKMIVKDGEGSTKFIEVSVSGANDDKEAKKAAMSISDSMLFKTAMYGSNANWGRIASAVGYSGVDFEPETMEISVKASGKEFKLFFGKALDVEKKEVDKAMKAGEITVKVELKQGKGSCTVWTSDLSADYVKINAEYN